MSDTTMSHTAWQKIVADLAGLLGWRVMHVRKCIGRRAGAAAWQTPTSIAGWPDLFLFHPKAGRTLAIEIKVGRDKPTTEQLKVLDELGRCGIRTLVAYPVDLPEVQRLLDTRALPPKG